jgi:signal transduction histidine kinase
MMLAAQRLKRALDSLPNGEKLAHIAGRLCASVDSLSETASGVSRIAREPVLDMQRADLHGILGKATTLIGRRACVQGVRIARHLAAPTPRVRAHEHFLTRAFFNLTTNAIDAMPSGGVLSLRTRTLEGGRVEVVVADDGEGIGTEDVESLFRPFTSSRSGHAGLGLTLARRIIELHGGSILLRPAPGGGTEAVSDLPFGAHEAGG